MGEISDPKNNFDLSGNRITNLRSASFLSIIDLLIFSPVNGWGMGLGGVGVFNAPSYSMKPTISDNGSFTFYRWLCCGWKASSSMESHH